MRTFNFILLFIALAGAMACTNTPSGEQRASSQENESLGKDAACYVYPKFFIETEEVRSRYFESVLKPVEIGELKAYSDEELTEEWDLEAYKLEANSVDSFYRPDPDTNEPGWEVVENSFSWDDVVAYKFKACITEDNHLRVKAIGPMVSLFSEGAPMGEFVLFWVDLEK